MLLKGKIKEEFGIDQITSVKMEKVIRDCASVYKGDPEWANENDHISTINFAKAVCSETARLALLGTKITIDGSRRAEWLQENVNKVYYNLREWIEYGCAFGTVILKPNGNGVDFLTPEDFIVTDSDNGHITGVVFLDTKEEGKNYYHRMEYHRYIGDVYCISNKCFVGVTPNDRGKPINIKNTPWKHLAEESFIENVKTPLYGVFKTPHANNVEIGSHFGLPVFYDAMEELKDLDIAYSRNAKEILDSKRTVLLDSDRLIPSGGKVANSTLQFNVTKKAMGLPDYVRNVYGNGQEDFYQEINPNLNTDTRLSGINALLSQIGYKVGYSNGYFVFNETTGIQTATGVEAEQQRTIQFIKDIRDKIEDCVDGLIYALSVVADLYNLSPVGDYEVTYDFGDITYNRDEDRSRWWGYVVSGKVPAWMFFTKFEGMSEEEAKKMVQDATPKQPTLFGTEE